VTLGKIFPPIARAFGKIGIRDFDAGTVLREAKLIPAASCTDYSFRPRAGQPDSTQVDSICKPPDQKGVWP
jgi:hypothetical protein